jgi:hypothetical protein
VPMSTPALIENPDGSTDWRYRPEYFRAAVEKSGLDLATIARRAGYSDSTPIARALGLRPEANKARGQTAYRKTIGYDVAVKLARAIGLDFHDVGI